MALPYQEWLKTIPSAFTNDPLWRMQVYRFALYLSDLVMEDSAIIAKTYHLNSLASQLYRSTTSIDANISEGYSCLTTTEQSQFYRYAFRSAREARGWYFKARTILGEETTQARIEAVENIIRMLTKMIQHRPFNNTIKDDEVSYDV